MAEQLLVWGVFSVVVLLLLVLDLKVFHRKAHTVNIKEALLLSAFWVALALLFNLLIYFWKGPDKALEFLTGYLLEKSLSVDNLFIFLLIFSYFKVPSLYQHKVLFWGIIGALVMRFLFIFAGIALIERFHWVIYIFGAFLVFIGIKMTMYKDKELHPENNIILRIFKKLMPVTDKYEGDKFISRIEGRRFATPLFVVLLVVETTDIVFAVDSIPAIFAITLDPFIVFTSNIFAILGLRALYFALSGVMQKFKYLTYGLSIILVFIGIKMLLASLYKIPIGITLGFILIVLLGTMLWSMISSRKEEEYTLSKKR